MAKQVCDELHIDQTDEELATITSLLVSSQLIVNDSIEYSDYPDIADSPLYLRAIVTLAQALYYDRSLTNGQPKGVLLMLDHLDAICLAKGAR
ncbi:hypothetical protein J0X23_05890 [Lactiplantibacillus plantarum]|nr:hypothetical protein FEM46_06155 [Lactiplantibacillus plantarum subsp. plantarum]QSW68352.1 hypothetical protein J0X23_05890 [Lactiplantibacillus plantarum]